MTINVGVIGCGRWGQNHVRTFSELPDSRVVGVCDKDESRVRTIQERYPDIPGFSDVHTFLAQDALDAIAVAIPVSAQYEVIKAALNAGKHVLAEKPFVLDLSQGTELVELAEGLDLTLMVGYVFLYNPAVQKLKSFLTDHGEGIGEVYYLYATRTNLGPIRKDVNAAWDLASHDIAIFSYLLEANPISAQAIGSRCLRNAREDVVFITLRYPGEILGHIHVSWADPNRVRQVVIVGSRRRIVFDDLNIQEQLRIFEKGVSSSGKDTDSFGEFVLSIRDGDIVSPRVEIREPLKNECSHFLQCIQGEASSPTDGPQALEVLKVLRAIQHSLENGGEAVEVSYEDSLHRCAQKPPLAKFH